ncbi:MAG: DegT/DnrJ/EryC1/StrS family aminotransferase [Rhodospirillales bacterium]|jgi:dTDP-3-amino-2,3,6-trideoxy-4-keto-D-glucose/dTDP-3-amino-3,4,6-trideoxy-alpha-D-glucose/dTDP-2,6-dideoxy-D-kanosamine transaminase|nr:DegT/DnrJ/EryC1/StrS family aminotransferase [Rhodospirillales bacterium]
MRVNYPYLHQQFAEVDHIFDDLRELVSTGQFTLGPFVEKFEKKFAAYIGVKHVISTNTGTDALILALKACGVKAGDEVITVANTFYATAGAIVAAGATPVFIDCDKRMQIDSTKIEDAITTKTAAIVPVHWMGVPADMETIMEIADRRKIAVVEDACPAVGAEIDGKRCGSFGKANGFSFHPLKPLNVWGDGGAITTNDDKVADFLRLYRNHGMTDRDHIVVWGINSRIQPIQAVVATRVLDTVDHSNSVRLRNATLLDEGLFDLSEFIELSPRSEKYKAVFQLYVIRAQRRDELSDYLRSKEIECCIHYPLPLHLQNAAKPLGYKRGDFPECEKQANEIITLPAHQYINEEQIAYTLEHIRKFYRG